MTDHFASWTETHRTPSAAPSGSAVVTHQTVHAVRVLDGAPGNVTMCGKRVDGPTGNNFFAQPERERCVTCVQNMGAPVLGT